MVYSGSSDLGLEVNEKIDWFGILFWGLNLRFYAIISGCKIKLLILIFLLVFSNKGFWSAVFKKEKGG